ncbi:DUF1800 domain-containing protein [Hydrocarboniphaga sp.]|uniref:DUF1800 domain-containing protein n=1 Tax=Hydrocarboniphaga sp. TaxID=2033016 RepID=UPI003D0E6593
MEKFQRGADAGDRVGLKSGWRSALPAIMVALLAACGGGSDDGAPDDGGDPTSPAGIGAVEAARLLTQASYGPTSAEITRVSAMSAAAYVDEQLAKPASSHLSECRNAKNSDGAIDKNSRTDTWWKLSLTAPDQLRQRLALALSEIFVVSDVGNGLGDAHEGLCYYYDLLAKDAFGNYRKLLEDVTLSPEMGRYLSMLGNRKPDPSVGRRADENFGREVMQLFSLGLNEVDGDGTPLLDVAGNPIPTYNQDDIENMARAFTGWTWGGSSSFFSGPQNWLAPMKAFDSEHDQNAKTLVGGISARAGNTAAADLALALDALYQNQNVGPFIARQLIQKLVTSNPSAAYVGRVAAVFDNDGKGVRGNLGAVVRALLLDNEARRGTAVNPQFGKVREPLLRQTHLWRALDAKAAVSGRYSYRGAASELGQLPLSALSVFNFFSPGYMPQGELREEGLVTPEYQLSNESSVPAAANRLYTAIYTDYVGRSGLSNDVIRVDLTALKAKAGDVQQLIDTLNLLLMSGQMDADFKAALKDHLTAIPTSSDGGLARVQDAVYLVMASPQYLIQR